MENTRDDFMQVDGDWLTVNKNHFIHIPSITYVGVNPSMAYSGLYFVVVAMAGFGHMNVSSGIEADMNRHRDEIVEIKKNHIKSSAH